MKTTTERNKELVLEAFDTLFNKRDYAAAEKFWSPDYIQHSAHIEPGREGLFNLVKNTPSTLKYEPGLVVADGDFVILHGRFSGFGLPVNWIVADILRIQNGILVEHWDVIQDEVTESNPTARHRCLALHFRSTPTRGEPLNSLLKLAVEAHGGLSAWEKLQGLSANVSVGGDLWDLKHISGLFAKINVELKLRYQQVLTHLLEDAQKMVFTPQSESGETIETRDDPRSAFGQSAETKWDKLHAGYFNSYALWGYLTTPFLYAYPGFDAREIDPWHENGERWRVLRVTFPDGYATHTRTQYSYFGEDGLLRRHLYTVDVLGGARGANYASEYRAVDGVMLSTRRRVFAYDDARQKVPEPILVSIDLSEIHFT